MRKRGKNSIGKNETEEIQKKVGRDAKNSPQTLFPNRDNAGWWRQFFVGVWRSALYSSFTDDYFSTTRRRGRGRIVVLTLLLG